MAGYCDTRRTIYIKCRQKIKERQLDYLKGKSKQKFTPNRNQSLLVQCICNEHTIKCKIIFHKILHCTWKISWKNLLKDENIFPPKIIFLTLVTVLLDFELVLLAGLKESWCWWFLALKGLTTVIIALLYPCLFTKTTSF